MEAPLLAPGEMQILPGIFRVDLLDSVCHPITFGHSALRLVLARQAG